MLLVLLPAVRPYGCTGGEIFMAEGSTRVAVFIDWQNVYKAACEAFGLGQLPNERGNFSPFKLARVLATGRGRGSAGDLLRVEVHRGLPSSSRDPVGYGANRRQATAWVKEGGSIVVPRLRPLRYPSPHAKDRAPVEKCIDVQLALAVAETILTDAADVAVLFTHDTDLLPAVEMVARPEGASEDRDGLVEQRQVRPTPARDTWCPSPSDQREGVRVGRGAGELRASFGLASTLRIFVRRRVLASLLAESSYTTRGIPATHT